MSNLDELARAIRERERAPVPVVEYRTPQKRRRGPGLDPPVLARFVGWSLTAFGALQAIIGALLMVGALVSLLNQGLSFGRAVAVGNSLMALAFVAGALAVTALGQILLLLAELVEQARSRAGS